MEIGVMTNNIMTLAKMTLSIIALSKMTLSIKVLSNMTLSKMTQKIIKPSIFALLVL